MVLLVLEKLILQLDMHFLNFLGQIIIIKLFLTRPVVEAGERLGFLPW